MAGPHAGNRNRPAYSGQSRFRFPKQIIELFAPRPPLAFKPPPKRRRLPPMTGLSAYVSHFGTLPPVDPDPAEKDKSPAKAPGETPVDKDSSAAKADMEMPDPDPDETSAAKAAAPIKAPAKAAAPTKAPAKSPATTFETPAKRRALKRAAVAAAVRARVAEATRDWTPSTDTDKKTSDAFRTLFVSGFALDTSAARLRAEFEGYGDVVTVIVPKDRDGVPRGYAFIEFEREAALKAAYKDARGRKIDGRRVLVDVERGRTVPGWLPNRLDGPNNAASRSGKKIFT